MADKEWPTVAELADMDDDAELAELETAAYQASRDLREVAVSIANRRRALAEGAAAEATLAGMSDEQKAALRQALGAGN